jgi:hypothetical protein
MSTQSKTSATVRSDEKILAYVSSERCELSRLQAAAVYAMLTWTAIALGIWAGLKVSARPAHSLTSVVPRTSPLSCRGVREIVAGAPLLADYVPIGLVEIDGSCFAILSKQAGPLPGENTVSGGGSADVFDHQGHLVRRYIATKHTNNSWELTELIALPSASAAGL